MHDAMYKIEQDFQKRCELHVANANDKLRNIYYYTCMKIFNTEPKNETVVRFNSFMLNSSFGNMIEQEGLF